MYGSIARQITFTRPMSLKCFVVSLSEAKDEHIYSN